MIREGSRALSGTEGWFADPSGRFGRRWFDGAAWTGDVVSADGRVVSDPLPEPGRSHPPSAWPETSGSAQGWQQPFPGQSNWAAPPLQQQGAPPPGGIRYAPGAGLAVAAVGLILAALSLFALDWADGSDGAFLDLSSRVRDAGSDAVNDNGIYLYAAWLGFVLFGVTVVLTVLAGLPVPPTAAGNRYPRIVCSLVAGLAAVLHTVAVVHVFRGPADPQFGAWLGVGGYLVVIVGMVLGARRVGHR